MHNSFLDNFKVYFTESAFHVRNGQIQLAPKMSFNLFDTYEESTMKSAELKKSLNMTLCRHLSNAPIDKKRILEYFFKQLETILIKQAISTSDKVEISDVSCIQKQFIDLMISFEKNRNKVKCFLLSRITMQLLKDCLTGKYRGGSSGNKYDDTIGFLHIDDDIANNDYFGTFYGIDMLYNKYIPFAKILTIGEHNYNTIFYHEDGQNYIASSYIDKDNIKLFHLTDKKLERMGMFYHEYDTSSSF